MMGMMCAIGAEVNLSIGAVPLDSDLTNHVRYQRLVVLA
jgi:hypothetical protein